MSDLTSVLYSSLDDLVKQNVINEGGGVLNILLSIVSSKQDFIKDHTKFLWKGCFVGFWRGAGFVQLIAHLDDLCIDIWLFMLNIPRERRVQLRVTRKNMFFYVVHTK